MDLALYPSNYQRLFVPALISLEVKCTQDLVAPGALDFHPLTLSFLFLLYEILACLELGTSIAKVTESCLDLPAALV